MNFLNSFLLLRLLDWLAEGTVKKLVLVITGVDSHEVLERLGKFSIYQNYFHSLFN